MAGAQAGFAFDPAPAVKPASPHAGHRQRLRDRASKSFDALPDYELLELLLARTIPRGDVKPLATALLARFGDLPGVHGATQAELKQVPGVGDAVALDLKLIHEAARRMSRTEAVK